jgi:hypothetical protein
MIFLTGGDQWIKVNNDCGFVDESGYVVGGGVEIGPRDIGKGGVTGTSGPHLRIQVETFKFQSVQPSIGIVFHFWTFANSPAFAGSSRHSRPGWKWPVLRTAGPFPPGHFATLAVTLRPGRRMVPERIRRGDA